MTSPLKEIVDVVNNTTLKHWLRFKGLRHSATNKKALAALLEKLIEEGDLTNELLDEAVLEIEEYGGGGKRIYLRRLKDTALVADKERFEQHLSDQAVSLSPK